MKPKRNQEFAQSMSMVAIAVISFVVPFYLFLMLSFSSAPKLYYTNIIAHSLVIFFICSTALSICYFYYVQYIQRRETTFFAIAFFFWVIGVILFFHAITIPSFYFLSEYVFDTAEHFSFFIASLSLLTILSFPEKNVADLIYRARKQIFGVSTLIMIVWFVFMVLSPTLAEMFFRFIDHTVWMSGVLIFASIIALFKRRALMKQYVSSPYLVSGLCIMINVAIIPFFYKEWNGLWWYFHFVVLASEIVVFIGILRKCDKKYVRLS